MLEVILQFSLSCNLFTMRIIDLLFLVVSCQCFFCNCARVLNI